MLLLMKLKLLSLLLIVGIFSFAQYTYVPDDRFEQLLINSGYDDVMDDYVLTSNIVHVTQLNFTENHMTDLTGIEDFVALEKLYLARNHNLNSLNVTNNTELKYLNISLTDINSIDLSQNTKLEELYCSGVGLTEIDLSNNILLKHLACGINNLTELDLSNNNLLETIDCSYNSISNLDLSNKPNLTSVDCLNNSLESLNLGGSQNLSILNCVNNSLTTLDLSDNVNLTILHCWENHLTQLDLTNNALLEYLYCDNNSLTTLMLSPNNSNLIELGCAFNNLTELNLNNYTGLESLFCTSNALVKLDLSTNSNLAWLICNENQLTQLNIKNGNNINMIDGELLPSGFDSSNNPNLLCIQVDNAEWSENNWNYFDEWSTFNENCNYMSTNEQDFTTFQIFPNPTKNTLNFSQELKEFNIYDLSGKLILKEKGNQINVSNLPNGTYLIKGITTSGKTINQKIIKN